MKEMITYLVYFFSVVHRTTNSSGVSTTVHVGHRREELISGGVVGVGGTCVFPRPVVIHPDLQNITRFGTPNHYINIY